MKKIRDYFYKNSIYIQKEVKKLIINSFLRVIYKPTPLKWPINDPTDDPTNNPTNGPADDSINNITNNFTNNSTLALLLLLTAPV